MRSFEPWKVLEQGFLTMTSLSWPSGEGIQQQGAHTRAIGKRRMGSGGLEQGPSAAGGACQ